MLLAEVEIAFSDAGERVRVLATADFDVFRGVGRKQLPTSIGGALIHVADHTQRMWAVVTTAKVLKGCGLTPAVGRRSREARTGCAAGSNVRA